MRMKSMVALAVLVSCSAAAVNAAETAPFDPATVDLADILACKIDGGHYVGFAMSVSDDDSPGGAKARGWVRLPPPSPTFSSYRLPEPLNVFGHATRTVAFKGSAMLAVLDLPDAAALGAQQGVTNVLAGSGRFMGERLVDDSTRVDPETGFRFKNRSVLRITTNPAFPGKTLIGCEYDGQLQPPA
ncbi:MAG TPA: hypothetical protein VNZ85_16100 [Caulobacter sp.]|nr:hypothetical protein [Caulobacter sp.]